MKKQEKSLFRPGKSKMYRPTLEKLSKEGTTVMPTAVPKLPKVVHWRNGKWVVVAGPFPDNFFRSETRNSVAKASQQLVDNCYNRPGTTSEEAYAKVLAADILEIDSGENEFGLVTP